MNTESSDTEMENSSSGDNISNNSNSNNVCHNIEIAEALKGDDENINVYFSEGKINSENISLKINDIGKITFPITEECAKQMISIASLAAFGHNEETKIDQNVRDTYMIPKEKIEISINNLDNILSTIQKELLLNENSGISASLHNLLIYRKGQFFKYHQDTEKLDNMVGTLVVSLPSPHIGGDLIINHLTKSHTFSTETIKADHAKYIAFYSDCHHKIEMIKDGYRVVVTYNLVLNQPNYSPVLSCNEKLVNLIKKYFETKLPGNDNYSRYRYLGYESNIRADDVPKLVCLLDHGYSKKEFTLSKLKGTDVHTASTLITVAKKLNLVIHLALAVVNETWTDMYDELDYLSSSDTTLGSWRDEHGNLLSFKNLCVEQEEVCWLRNNKKFKATDINKQYTGNEGVQEDRQYKRATIILWPKTFDTKMILLLNYDMGLLRIKEFMKASHNQDIVCEMITEACKFKNNSTNNVYTQIFVEAAIYIKNPEKALEIATYVCDDIFNFDSEISPLFMDLKNAYGSSWSIQLLNATANKSFSKFFVTKFIPYFKKLGEQELVNKLLKDQAEIVKAQKIQSTNETSILHNYGCIIKTAYDANCTDIISYVLETIISQNWQLPNLASFYIDYCKHMNETISNSFKETVVKYLQEDITKLKKTVSSKMSWAISCNKYCSCALCSDMVNFLSSESKCTGIKLNKEKRKHLYQQFESQGRQQYSMRTNRIGSPFTLIIEKSDEIHNAPRRTLDKLEKLLDAVLSIPESLKAAAPLVAESTATAPAPDVSRKRSAETAVEAAAAKKSLS